MSDREDSYSESPNKHRKLLSSVVRASTPIGKHSRSHPTIGSYLTPTSKHTSPRKRRLSEGTPGNKSFHELLSLSDYKGSAATTPSGRDNKSGWYDIHQKHVNLSLNSKTILVLIGDSIVAGLSRYANIWRTFFKTFDALNYGIGGDRTQHVLWRAENATLPNALKYVVIHCGTNNIDRDQPRDIANGVISVGLTLQEKCHGLKVIVTGLLPRDPEWSHRRKKIKLINYHLKKLCRDKFNDFYYMKQDDDWTDEDGKLDETLYYTDQLHLIEAGNRKFACSILKILSKLMKDEKVSYSSDENEPESDNSASFERAYGRKRKAHYSFEFNSNESFSNKRLKRALNGDSHSRSFDDIELDRDKKHEGNEDTPFSSKWSKARKWGNIIKKEYHDKYKLDNRSKSSPIKSKPKTERELEDERRKLLRLERFSDISKKAIKQPKSEDSEKTSNHMVTRTSENLTTHVTALPSVLAMKIRQSQLEQRIKLDRQKSLKHTSLVTYSSPDESELSQEEASTSSSFNESIQKSNPSRNKLVVKDSRGLHQNYKKFFSDYTADSDSE